MSDNSLFIERSTIKAGEHESHRRMLRVLSTLDQACEIEKRRQFINWEDARTKAARLKQYTLENLPDLLQAYEQKVSERGGRVLWARDAHEAQRHLVAIATRHHATKVVKAKSTTTEEVQCTEVLTRAGVEVCETEVGEFVVQLADEKPSHLVASCLHKSKEEVAQLFHEKLGTALTDTVQDLTLTARRHLRPKFSGADIGISGANFLIADEGVAVVVENEGNARLCMSCPPVHVVIAGIEKVLPRLADLDLFLPLLAVSASGQHMTTYASLVRGARQAEELDGPQAFYVILLDNGRSRLYAEDAFRDALKCIRCGACLNVCPVYKTIGGQGYGTTYQGPIGAVITPHMKGVGAWNHLSFASTLCGACGDVCPLKIPLPEMLLMNRVYTQLVGKGGWFWGLGIKAWSFLFKSGRRVAHYHTLVRWGVNLVRRLVPGARRELLPRLAEKTFSDWWNKHGKP